MSCICRAFYKKSPPADAHAAPLAAAPHAPAPHAPAPPAPAIPSDISWKETTVFVPPVSTATVIKVYDGDTITVASRLPFTDDRKDTIWRFSVRLNGIDCPEIRGKCETEKRVAQIGKSILSDKILGKTVLLENVELEKYGRLLATVNFEGLNLNEWMVEQRLAVAYDGGTKKCPDNWEVYYNDTKI